MFFSITYQKSYEIWTNEIWMFWMGRSVVDDFYYRDGNGGGGGAGFTADRSDLHWLSEIVIGIHFVCVCVIVYKCAGIFPVLRLTHHRAT